MNNVHKIVLCIYSIGIAIYNIYMPEYCYAQKHWKSVISNQSIDQIVITSKQHIIATGRNSATYRSKNAGETWEILFSSSERVFVFGDDKLGNIYIEKKAAGVYKSTNNGDSWEIILNKDMFDIKQYGEQRLLILNNGHLLFATGNKTNGILRSTDCGLTWISINNGVEAPDCVWLNGEINSDILLSNINSKIYITTNEGNTWLEQENKFVYPDTNTRAGVYIIDESPNGELLASGFYGYASDDTGRTWEPLTYKSMYFTITNSNRTRYDSSSAAYVIGSTLIDNGIIIKYSKRGNIKEDIKYNIGNYNCTKYYDITTTHSGVVFLATDVGLFKLVDNENDITELDDNTAVRLRKVYPLPANEILNVECETNKCNEINIRIYNTNGRIILEQVYVLVNEGTNIYKINVRNIQGGAYIIETRYINACANRKIIVN